MEELEEAAGEVTGQVTAGNSLSTEVAAPWNTSITIPAVQITQFHRHGRRPYHQPFSALPWTLCKFVHCRYVWNVQFLYKHCAPYVVDFVLNFLLYRISFCTKFIFIQIATHFTQHTKHPAHCSVYLQFVELHSESVATSWASAMFTLLPMVKKLCKSCNMCSLCKVLDLCSVQSVQVCIVGLWARALQSRQLAIPQLTAFVAAAAGDS